MPNRAGRWASLAIRPCGMLAVIDPRGVPDQTLAIMNDEMRAFHRESGMAVIPYSSQANGRFSKMQRGPERYADKLKRLGPKRMLLQGAALRVCVTPCVGAISRRCIRRRPTSAAFKCSIGWRRSCRCRSAMWCWRISLRSRSGRCRLLARKRQAQLADCVAASALRLTSAQLAEIET